MFIANEMIKNNRMLASNEVSDVEGSNKSIKKLIKSKTRKIFKLRKLKSKKLFKSQKLTKSRKNLLKNRNSSYFDIKKNGPSFLTPKARTAYNCL